MTGPDASRSVDGASQAILDATSLAGRLAGRQDVEAALMACDEERRPATAQIVRGNRTAGPERVIDLVEERAPEGFMRRRDVASHAELEGIVTGYSKMAGFDRVRQQ